MGQIRLKTFSITVDEIREMLPKIFLEGTENRNYLIREMAAKTIFVMLYTESIEGMQNMVRPNQITKMSDEQALKVDYQDRVTWYNNSLKKTKKKDWPNRWYAENTREPIRDETLRFGLVSIGAVLERKDLPTTSSKPRYYLQKKFADLFLNKAGDKEIRNWQEEFLSTSALARIKINAHRKSVLKDEHSVFVKFPNGETRFMSPGPSSILSKDVIENFTQRFLKDPALIFLSESGNKVVSQDNELALSLGLKIEVDKNLPDIILADLGTKDTTLIFVEVVATDGPINRIRKEALTSLIEEAGFDKRNVLFLTVFADRSSSVFKKLVSDIAWGSLVWFASEPDYIIVYSESGEQSIEQLLKMTN